MQNYPIDMSMKPDVEAFFDAVTNTISYVISDPKTKACAVVDSVMDIDYASGRITHDHADRIVDHITSNQLTLEWIIETHVPALLCIRHKACHSACL
jgi:glyoxylase-like metal-dependent hydrolase (beta-lactamase superfamily II)